MHNEVLNDNQKEILPLMAKFKREYIIPNPPSDQVIKDTLISIATAL